MEAQPTQLASYIHHGRRNLVVHSNPVLVNSQISFEKSNY